MITRDKAERTTMTLEDAGRCLGMSGNFLRRLLREGKMQEVGYAVEMANGRWRYFVYKEKVKALSGVDPDEKR